MDNYLSQQAADKCILSAKKHNVEVEKWAAITPRNPDFKTMVVENKLRTENFTSGHSRSENALACFLSHMSIWKESAEKNETIMILEHDAVFVNTVPSISNFTKVVTLGEPSYGKYNTPTKLGLQSLVQREYFKGAHAYVVTPIGSKELLQMVSDYSRPTDVYLNIQYFPWLEEYYPWPVRVDDHFSTIQNQQGCIAKHNYNRGIELIEA